MINSSLKVNYTTFSNSLAGVTDVTDDIFKILQEEINNEFVFDILVDLGWYRFIKPKGQQWHEQDIKKWIQQNCTGKYIHKINVCLFENREDAVKFNLTWC